MSFERGCEFGEFRLYCRSEASIPLVEAARGRCERLRSVENVLEPLETSSIYFEEFLE